MFTNQAFKKMKEAKNDDDIITVLANLYDEAFRYGYQDGYWKVNVDRYLEK